MNMKIEIEIGRTRNYQSGKCKIGGDFEGIDTEEKVMDQIETLINWTEKGAQRALNANLQKKKISIKEINSSSGCGMS